MVVLIQNNGKNRSYNADDHHFVLFCHCDHNDDRDHADYHYSIFLMIMKHDSGDSDNGEEG